MPRAARSAARRSATLKPYGEPAREPTIATAGRESAARLPRTHSTGGGSTIAASAAGYAGVAPRHERDAPRRAARERGQGRAIAARPPRAASAAGIRAITLIEDAAGRTARVQQLADAAPATDGQERQRDEIDVFGRL